MNKKSFLARMRIGVSVAVVAITLSAVSSCSPTKDIVYFQDLKPGTVEDINNSYSTIKLRPGDKLSINVTTRDEQMNRIFNLQYGQINSSSTRTQLGYTVNGDGNIEFPIVGTIHVAGLSRDELEQKIKDTLIEKQLVKDPVVSIDYLNLGFSVLGEVARPGYYTIDRDSPTLLEAIGMAGDLTIEGVRDTVLIMRQENGKQHVYSINMTDNTSITSSPAYYLQQNDVIYVKPNKYKQRQTTVNGNTVRSTSFWISLASLLTSIFVLIK